MEQESLACGYRNHVVIYVQQWRAGGGEADEAPPKLNGTERNFIRERDFSDYYVNQYCRVFGERRIGGGRMAVALPPEHILFSCKLLLA